MRVYDLGLTDVGLAADVVKGLLSPEGRVYPDPRQHRLVVSDRPDVHRRVAEALRTLDVPARNVRIEVDVAIEQTGTDRGVGVTGGTAGVGVGGGTVRVGGGGGRSRGDVAVTGRDTRSTTDVHSRQQLVVLSGGEASLTVAELVPYSQWLFTWGVAHALWSQSVQWQEVGTSLVVSPRVLGDGRILVRLTPRVDYRARDGSQSVTVNELTTEVMVREGEPILLGGVPFKDEEFRQRFLLGVDRAGTTSRVAMTLRASVE
jgi:type II secretory pathway component GspD/PulD (secretin)